MVGQGYDQEERQRRDGQAHQPRTDLGDLDLSACAAELGVDVLVVLDELATGR
jgi:hypothetical protein